MRTIKLGETEVRAQGSPLALFYYQREFATADGPADWYADYERDSGNLDQRLARKPRAGVSCGYHCKGLHPSNLLRGQPMQCMAAFRGFLGCQILVRC